jgi:uncharacterized membrane protein YgcG
LVETAFAAALVVLFFVALFMINTQCLYFVNSSRELTAAGQTAQSTLEELHNCTWTQLTNPNYIGTSVLNNPMNNGASGLGTLTEVVTINKYPSPSPSPIKVTRVGSSAGSGTITIGPSPNPAIATANLVKIDLQLSWKTGPGGRSRSIGVSTIYAKPDGSSSASSSSGGSGGSGGSGSGKGS